MSVVLDTGALIALDKTDRRVAGMLRAAHQEGLPVRTSAAALAQVWRDGARQAGLARFLGSVETVALSEQAARVIGALLGESRTSDVVDAHVAMLVEGNGRLLTSDEKDLRALLRAREVKATVVPV